MFSRTAFLREALGMTAGCVCSSEEARVWEERKDFPLVKRHSEGTFSNDYSKYLETQRAQDFVQWLMNSKRSGGPVRRHADGTYTSDVSAYLQDQAAKDFITWLKSGQPKQVSSGHCGKARSVSVDQWRWETEGRSATEETRGRELHQ
ncbi:hypothetical protein NFI96_025959 [Prochilodus magdalenae]|nr:hypothetical protein NFI96_025959 [Prochilodus magdalenae]